MDFSAAGPRGGPPPAASAPPPTSAHLHPPVRSACALRRPRADRPGHQRPMR